MKNLIIIMLLLITAGAALGQEDKLKSVNFYFEGPIITDSASTVMIPVSYSVGLFTSNKLALWGSYYSNIIFYNFRTDSSFRLFPKETYIVSFRTFYYNKTSFFKQPDKNFSKEWILYRVKNIDYNSNGKIDQDDPDILYTSDVRGKNLKRVTGEDENVVSIDVFYEQNFALIKIQRDANKNKEFELNDRDFYYVRFDLSTLTLGQKIEVR